MVDCAEKVQHLQRCSPYNLRKPRVACTIVWQPWAIKGTTLIALIHVFRNTISVVSCGKKRQIMHLFTPTHFTLYYQQHHLPQLTLKQLPPFPWLTTPLPLWGGVGGEASFSLLHFTFSYQHHRHPKLIHS